CQQARDNNVGIALSNPCFELWALYHFIDWDKPGSQNDVIRALAKHVKAYAKGKKVFVAEDCGADVTKQLQAVRDACKRGQTSVKRRHDEGSPHGCPSSTCHLLVRKFLPT